jgi:hypothetical protein
VLGELKQQINRKKKKALRTKFGSICYLYHHPFKSVRKDKKNPPFASVNPKQIIPKPAATQSPSRMMLIRPEAVGCAGRIKTTNKSEKQKALRTKFGRTCYSYYHPLKSARKDKKNPPFVSVNPKQIISKPAATCAPQGYAIPKPDDVNTSGSRRVCWAN